DLDLDAIREMLARFIEHHMAARHQKQSLATLEEEAAGRRQQALLFKCEDARGSEENGFDHQGLLEGPSYPAIPSTPMPCARRAFLHDPVNACTMRFVGIHKTVVSEVSPVYLSQQLEPR